MRSFFDQDDSDGILLIDADNAFNRVNRAVALWNIQYTCPVMKHVLVNFYRTASRIFMNGDKTSCELLSQGGTAQGCPLAMAMYALSLVPLLKQLRMCRQVWYADDATGCDSFVKLRSWFDTLLQKGPLYGYYPKPSKCILLTRPDRVSEANALFNGSGIKASADGSKDSGIEITTSGTRHLGAVLGTSEFKAEYVKKKVDGWVRAVRKMAAVSASEPHAVFAAFTHVLQGQWTFLSRAMPGISPYLQPLEDAIRLLLIPTMLRRQVSDVERDSSACLRAGWHGHRHSLRGLQVLASILRAREYPSC